jgi:hypothetical protein
MNKNKMCDFCGLTDGNMWVRNVEGEHFVCQTCVTDYYENLDMDINYKGDDEIYL